MVEITRCLPHIRVIQNRSFRPLRCGFSYFRNGLKWLLQPSTLRVWRVSTKQGKDYWKAFNPKTGRSFSGSEADIRHWIESQYRQ